MNSGHRSADAKIIMVWSWVRSVNGPRSTFRTEHVKSANLDPYQSVKPNSLKPKEPK